MSLLVRLRWMRTSAKERWQQSQNRMHPNSPRRARTSQLHVNVRETVQSRLGRQTLSYSVRRLTGRSLNINLICRSVCREKPDALSAKFAWSSLPQYTQHHQPVFPRHFCPPLILIPSTTEMGAEGSVQFPFLTSHDSIRHRAGTRK